MVNKKGASPIVWLLIALALGLVVLVILSGGFVKTWNKFMGTVGVAGGDDLSEVSQTCNLAASSGDPLKLTSVTRNVKNLPEDTLRGLITNEADKQKLGTDPIKITISSAEVTITKDKVLQGVTCAQLRDAGLISY